MIDEAMRDRAILRLARLVEWLANREKEAPVTGLSRDREPQSTTPEDRITKLFWQAKQAQAMFLTLADMADNPANLPEIARLARLMGEKDPMR